MTTFLANRDIYTSVICDLVPQARERLWIATADIKDMYVDVGGRDMVPFLAVLDRMRKRGVGIRCDSMPTQSLAETRRQRFMLRGFG